MSILIGIESMLAYIKMKEARNFWELNLLKIVLFEVSHFFLSLIKWDESFIIIDCINIAFKMMEYQY